MGHGHALLKSHYSVVLGTALVYTTLVTTLNLLVDLAYAWLDPRVRSQV
jgi:oligopeptide transport system permease protein